MTSKVILGLGVFAFVLTGILMAEARVRGRHTRLTILDVMEELKRLLGTMKITVEHHALPVTAIGLMALVGYTSYLGASLLRPTERLLMRGIAVAAAIVTFEGHRRLAAQEQAPMRRQNKLMLMLLLLPFCAVSVLLASLGLYGNSVARNLTQMEESAWRSYYSSSRSAIATKVGEVQDEATKHHTEMSAKLAALREETYDAQLEHRVLRLTPEQAGVRVGETRASEWRSKAGDIKLPPPLPATDRQTAESDLASSLEQIDRVIAQTPPPLVIRTLVLAPYQAPSTELLQTALEAVKRHDSGALFCIGICMSFEFYPLAALLMRRRRVYLHEVIEGWRRRVVLTMAVFRRSWREDSAVMAEEEVEAGSQWAAGEPVSEVASPESGTPSQMEVPANNEGGFLIEFEPPVRPKLCVQWKRKPALEHVTFGDVQQAVRSAAEAKLSAIGHRVVDLVTAEHLPLVCDLGFLTQLRGGTLIAMCEPLQSNQ